MTAATILLALACAGLLARCWQLKSRLIDQEWDVIDLVIRLDETEQHALELDETNCQLRRRVGDLNLELARRAS